MNDAIQYEYCPDKDKQLREQRGIGFADVIEAINSGRLLERIQHHNQQQYPGQVILVVEIGGYAYEVPYEYRGTIVRLISIWPSRKMTKLYKLKGSLK